MSVYSILKSDKYKFLPDSDIADRYVDACSCYDPLLPDSKEMKLVLEEIDVLESIIISRYVDQFHSVPSDLG